MPTTSRTGFHAGEAYLQDTLHVPSFGRNPTQSGLPPHFAARVAASPLAAIGTLDADGYPWTSVWGGTAGHFLAPLQDNLLAMTSLVDARWDPVAQLLFGTSDETERHNGTMSDALWDPLLFASSDEAGHRLKGTRRVREGAYHITREELDGGGGRVMSAVSMNLAVRDRVKLAGRLVAGMVESEGEGAFVRVQMAMLVEESLGNCPKYLNKRTLRPHIPLAPPVLVSDALPLPQAAVDLLARADVFFVSSSTGKGAAATMDTNHRGGARGFVRVVTNEEEGAGEGTVLVFPEYSGNRLYQTLGNLHVQPRAGLCVPDFATGEVLYLTGETTILYGADAAAVVPRAKIAVKVRVVAARFVRDALVVREDPGRGVEFSPYNPPVQRLVAMKGVGAGGAIVRGGDEMVAKLVGRELLTATIARFKFKLETPAGWKAGQHVTLDFAEELDIGYSHMLDDDPTRLNDDYVRTFTVSSMPPPAPGGGADEFEITVRRHGPATSLMWQWNLRVPLEVPVLGFGGEEEHRVPEMDDGVAAVFVAAGVGITPALAQAPGLLVRGRSFKLLWALKGADLAFAEDVFGRIPGLAERTVVFVTSAGESDIVKRLGGFGAEVISGRRMGKEDVLQTGEGTRRKFYLCTGSAMLKVVTGWLDGEDVAYESFDY